MASAFVSASTSSSFITRLLPSQFCHSGRRHSPRSLPIFFPRYHHNQNYHHLNNHSQTSRQFRSCLSPPSPPSSSIAPSITDSESDTPFFDSGITLPSNAPTVDELLRAAHAAADASDKIILSYFRQPIPVDFKSDASPVTLADKQAESAIRDTLISIFPDYPVLGEEHSENEEIKETIGFMWVVDPIDGTRAFICGRPTFTTLIALTFDGLPILSVISQPVTCERWAGAFNRQTTLNSQPVSISTNKTKLSECIVQATTPEMFEGINSVLFRRVTRRARNTVYGGDGYAYALLSIGCGDIIVEADMKPWDYLALVPIVEGAGGLMSDWAGAPLRLKSDGRVVATASTNVYEEVMNVLAIAEEEFGLVPRQTQISEDLAVLGASDVESEGGNGVDMLSLDDPGEGHVESMTGFGRAVLEKQGFYVSVTVRSLNSKHCDVQLRGAGLLARFESELIGLVKILAVRGRVSVNLDIDLGIVSNDNDSNINLTSAQGNENQNISNTSKNLDSKTMTSTEQLQQQQKKKRNLISVDVDEDAVRQVRTLLDKLSKAGGITKDPTIADVLRFSDVLIKQDSGIAPAKLLPVVREAIVQAVNDMRKSRRLEGAILEEDILKRTRKITHILDDVAQRAPDRVIYERERLSKVLKSAALELENENGDGNGMMGKRIETEVTIFADRVDYTEEVVRLKAHIQVFEMTIVGSDEPVGQRLGFLLQEMNREANTLAAKASDAPVSQLSVLIKEEIEKIREQCSNLR